MKKWLSLFSLILVITIISSCKKPTPYDPYPFDPSLYNQSDYSSAIDNYIKARMTNGNIQGLAVAVIKNHKVEFMKGYGYLRTLAGQPVDSLPKVTVNTNFYTGEVSYPMVTMAVMQLHDQGLVDMDVDINQYIDFPVQNPVYTTDPITLRMLISGTSTILDDPIDFNFLTNTGSDASMRLDTFLKASLSPTGVYYPNNYYTGDKPGRYYAPSRTAISLAAYVVEKVKGVPFNEYCKAYIYPQLGIFGTSFLLQEMDMNTLAVGHTNTPFPFTERPYKGIPGYPGGQLRTNITGLSRVLLTFIEKGKYNQQRMIDTATINTMNAIAYPIANPNQATTFQYMNFNGRNLLGISSVDADILNEGSTNRMWFDPLTKIGVVILSNTGNSSPQVDSIMEKLFINAE